MKICVLQLCRRNILNTQESDYLSNCTYNSHDKKDRFCPIFSLGYIVEEAGENFHQMALSVSSMLFLVAFLSQRLCAGKHKYSFPSFRVGLFRFTSRGTAIWTAALKSASRSTASTVWTIQTPPFRKAGTFGVLCCFICKSTTF